MWVFTKVIRNQSEDPRCSWTTRSRWRRFPCYECDVCGASFETSWGDKRKGELQFCSHRCSTKAEWSADRIASHADLTRKRNLERWASAEERTAQSEKIKRTHADPAVRLARGAAIRAAMDNPDFKRKRSIISKLMVPRMLEANRAIGNVRESAGERAFVAWLKSVLGDDDVLHHPHHVNGFDIDVFVRSADAYIQFDGIYYHGLDRPYSDLTPMIRRKYDRDRAADRRFKELGMRLVRITDREWSAMTTEPQRLEWLSRLREDAAAE